MLGAMKLVLVLAGCYDVEITMEYCEAPSEETGEGWCERETTVERICPYGADVNRNTYIELR